MSRHELLGQLNTLHQMMNQLPAHVPEEEAYREWHPRLAPLAWYLGRAVYLETWWVQELVQGDSGMTGRVRHLFGGNANPPSAGQWRQLPPLDHLLNWALELQERNLTALANPATLGDHPLVAEQRLLPLVLQDQALLYEQMLMVLAQRQLQLPIRYRVRTPLTARPPSHDLVGMAQGHYRIGALDDPAARDNELPPQVVQLSSFRIDRLPVANGAWLGFMEAGGYDDPSLWDEAGWEWRTRERIGAPDHWRRDADGHWYGIGINGPFDLDPEEAVMGISRHEATAYARWVATSGDGLAGAVVQHEYQWEIAARTRAISGYGRVWEWCANGFHPYDGYRPPPWEEAVTREFDHRHHTLRGAGLHTQRICRRPSIRLPALPEARHLFSGTRLVFPYLG
ncbi:MAG TPA: ergothioneine biosynthesis protein EgtB [Sedimenticola thiotaurini]|uniref:Ergothioneine biosynthesis protein EgtB n=1 Tax=Sedimenticola thiotaurini TaxID=1543721 RepID=A0A831RMK9_9GAMM|nr:ergothioneine biosynthesis protein EgtB [Sedimenticola thiotaurini]